MRPVVVHVLHSLAVGGLETGVVKFINGSTTEVEHRIVCMTRTGTLADRVDPAIPVAALGKREGNDVRALLRLVRLLRAWRPAIVHSRNWGTFDAVFAARLAAIPTVLHSEHGRDASDPDGRSVRRRRLRRLAAPLINRFVAVSDDLRRWLVEEVGIKPAKVVRIRNGVDTARFAPGDRLERRRATGLPLDALIVGTVGRLDPVKDHVGLVAAFARVAATHPRAFLVIVGEGIHRQDIEAEIDRHGLGNRVKLLGERHDVPALLASLDVFVLSSIGEGLSNTVLEAMATGLPIVATRVGGNPELVDDGTNGLLVPRSDPAALAGALGAYLSDAPRRCMHGAASRERAHSSFSLERTRTAYLDLYREVAWPREKTEG